MDLQLTNQTVVITGGSKGIGLACAEAFLQEGARVALWSRSADNLDAARRRLLDAGFAAERVLTQAVDLVDADAAGRAAEATLGTWGRIDILINSAGAARRYAPAELNAAAWKQALDAKFFSYVHAMDAVLPSMREAARGAIVNVIGMGGKVAGNFHIAGGAANAALMLATTGLAAAYASQGIRINGINPGLTRTGRVEEGFAVEVKSSGLTPDQVLARAQAKIPFGRMADPAEIARVALFLASPQASYVVGAIVPMDGAANPVI